MKLMEFFGDVVTICGLVAWEAYLYRLGLADNTEPPDSGRGQKVRSIHYAGIRVGAFVTHAGVV
jgi:hypothetical protein